MDEGIFYSIGPDDMERLMQPFPVKKAEHAATDGISAVMERAVNAMNSENMKNGSITCTGLIGVPIIWATACIIFLLQLSNDLNLRTFFNKTSI
ncbi:hypothetical protein [Gorillibacterium massiliense]|uniref:hypothetical protein n=1 Tax=Gorillibacterium massiliense TaxID=1280390 RepID=UPI0012DD2D10|nr:hypothetical protein [Gorillibacterium massiliense]